MKVIKPKIIHCKTTKRIHFNHNWSQRVQTDGIQDLIGKELKKPSKAKLGQYSTNVMTTRSRDMMVWAFNKADDQGVVELIHESVKAGKSRFGWSQRDEHDLRAKDNWTEWHSAQLFLLQIQKGDWIVHINTPTWGKCTAAKVISDYSYDEGLECPWGKDFRHFFQVDPNSVITFDRNDPNVISSVNLAPRKRYHRVYDVENFLLSIENLQELKVVLNPGESREEYHIKDQTCRFLKEITTVMHQMNRGKQLERYLAKVFRRIPGVIDVNENGFGWRSDYGADLIVTMANTVGGLEFEERIIVQVKSYGGNHDDTKAVEQVVAGIKRYGGTAGMIVTTGERTEALEQAIESRVKEDKYIIDLIAGDEVAKFVLRYAPDMLFRTT